MTAVLEVVVAVALGAVGTLVRAEAGWWSVRRTGTARAGTWLVNLAGAFALGLVVALAGQGQLAPATARVLGVGFLGGLTTFSTWMVLVLRPTADAPPVRRGRDTLVHGLGMLLAGVAAAAAGGALALLLT